MKFLSTPLSGVMIIEPKIFKDSRGFFCETYRKDLFVRNGIVEDFVQDNQSSSMKGTLRGLHFQLPPKAQSKLVRVVKGEVFDVAVDIRKGSETFGHWAGFYLSEENQKILYVPEGFAHGFLALADGTQLIYACSDFYSPENERGIAWNDPELNISWPGLGQEYLLSSKDRINAPFSEYRKAENGFF